jgi:hypothetical protein
LLQAAQLEVVVEEFGLLRGAYEALRVQLKKKDASYEELLVDLKMNADLHQVRVRCITCCVLCPCILQSLVFTGDRSCSQRAQHAACIVASCLHV